MDERMKFIARLLEGEKMSELCEEFNISRKTGYKILKRYRDTGVKGLTDRSRRPYRFANKLPMQIEKFIIQLKNEKPTWGAAKIRERLHQKYPDIWTPAKSTVHCILDRHGLVEKRRKRKYKARGTALSVGLKPNDLWSADFKGQFRLGNEKHCYPLTISDYFSRYLLACEGLETLREVFSFNVFERVFQEYGLPKSIRTDNGYPFASPYALFGLSKLSVWWLRLGIEIERIRPGHPEQNGRHERIHLTLKKETIKPPALNILQQQAKFDAFIEEYNKERPHEALQMKSPSEIYVPSTRIYRGLPPVEYPTHDLTLIVTNCGRICIRGAKVNFSQVFAGQSVGIKEVNDRIWLVSFMNYDLGYFDEDSERFEPLENPFGPRLMSPMSPE